MKEIQTCPICNGRSFSPLADSQDFTITQQKFPVVQCIECGLGITTPRPEDEDLSTYYLSEDYISHSDKPTSIYDSIYQLARNYTLRSKLNLLKKLSPGVDVLDYGCGTGDFLAFLQQNGYNITGVEPSPIARAIATKKTGTAMLVSSIEGLDKQYDIITLWHVLEHVPNLDETLNQLKARLRPDGYLLVAVPNLNSWDSTHYRNFWAAFDTPRHLWHFTKKSMTRLARNHQLTIAKIIPMKLDAFYVSLLSEKYKNDRKHSLGGTIHAIANGLRSNLNAQKTGEYSSLIYVVQNEVR